MCYHAQLIGWDEILLTFYLDWLWTLILSISASWVFGITGMSHCVRLLLLTFNRVMWHSLLSYFLVALCLLGTFILKVMETSLLPFLAWRQEIFLPFFFPPFLPTFILLHYIPFLRNDYHFHYIFTSCLNSCLKGLRMKYIPMLNFPVIFRSCFLADGLSWGSSIVP
jgi:hypothetical protein